MISQITEADERKKTENMDSVNHRENEREDRKTRRMICLVHTNLVHTDDLFVCLLFNVPATG